MDQVCIRLGYTKILCILIKWNSDQYLEQGIFDKQFLNATLASGHWQPPSLYLYGEANTECGIFTEVYTIRLDHQNVANSFFLTQLCYVSLQASEGS